MLVIRWTKRDYEEHLVKIIITTNNNTNFLKIIIARNKTERQHGPLDDKWIKGLLNDDRKIAGKLNRFLPLSLLWEMRSTCPLQNHEFWERYWKIWVRLRCCDTLIKNWDYQTQMAYIQEFSKTSAVNLWISWEKK